MDTHIHTHTDTHTHTHGYTHTHTHTQKPEVSINKAVWLSTSSATVMYIVTGLFGAWAYAPKELRSGACVCGIYV